MTSVRYTARPIKPWRGAAPRRRAAIQSPSQPDGPRRALNFGVAALGLVVTAPLLAAIALLIKLTSRGPVFYTQTRVGIDRRDPGAPGGNSRRRVDYGGQLFTIYKFRTMATTGNGSGGGAEVWATPNDPRVTLVGRLLRVYRLDELPQLINVLRGDMNLVGPRPEQPKIFALLRDRIEGYELRQRVMPGITGWAQVNLRYDTSLDDVRKKIQLDLEYVARRSVAEDLKIMLRTLPVVAFKQGAW